jgi:hypothetical protein
MAAGAAARHAVATGDDSGLKRAAAGADVCAMDSINAAFLPPLHDHRGRRQHRFMESSDINAAFRELFGPLRTSIRRGMTIDGQIYAMEMDPCIPGQLLATAWIPRSARGIDDPHLLADGGRRRALFDRLLAETRPESLFVHVCERVAGRRVFLYVEVVSADACYVAEYPVRAGRGFHQRELIEVPHRRVDAVALGT